MTQEQQPKYHRQWREYTTAAGNSPVEQFLDDLSDADLASVLAAMEEVAERGLEAARQLRGDIYEVRADGDRQAFRVLFAAEAYYGQVLLALHGFSKKTQKTPPQYIRLAETRLKDWRARGGAMRKAKAEAGPASP